MVIGKIIKASILSAIALASSMVVSVSANAADTNRVIFREDYENVAVNSRPTYGDSNWTGDTSASHPECSVGVITDKRNKVFLMKYTGTGQAVTADPLVYRNMNLGSTETQVFAMSVKTADKNSYKDVYIRNSSGSTRISLFKFNGSNAYALGKSIGTISTGAWYNLKFVFSGSSKSVEVFVNDTSYGTTSFSSWDITNMSIRAQILGSTTNGYPTSLTIDNVTYTVGDIPISFKAALPWTSETIFCLDSSKAYYSNAMSDLNLKVTSYHDHTMIPAASVATAFSGSYSWNSSGYGTLVVNGKTCQIYEGKILVGGTQLSVDMNPVLIDGNMYISADTVASIMGQSVDIRDNGAIIYYSSTINETNVTAILEQLMFTSPDAAQILWDFQTNNPNNEHPRILLTQDRLDTIKTKLKQDDMYIGWYKAIRSKADTALTTAVSVYELRDGERLLYVSREVMDNVMYPAFVYLIEGEQKYLDRAVNELLAAAAFTDWHPAHFLDTAEMTLALALGYDWLYDYLTEAQKTSIRTAILRLGLDAADEAYEGTATYDSTVSGAQHNRLGWVTYASNWTIVCNGGIVAGACAVMGDDESAYCAEIISKALKSSEVALKLFAPDGAWAEGLNYWEYACRYLSHLISSVDNTMRTDYDYSMVPGILSTATFPVYMSGPKGIFNYGDTEMTYLNASVLFWFADALQDASLNAARFNMINRYGFKGGIYDMLLYNPNLGSSENNMAKDKMFRDTEVAVSTNSHISTNANYIGIKSGVIGLSHGDLDAGVFIIDALGERWTKDWGKDSYSLTDYFFWPGRANYYRKRAEGHCALVLNPDGQPDQIPESKTFITDFISGDMGSCTVVDTTAAYADDATSVRRASVLFDDRNKMMIQDEVKCNAATDIYWFMQTTKKNITIAADGKSLVISDGNNTTMGKRLKMILQSDCSTAKFTYGAAEPLPQSPVGTGQTANDGYRIQVLASGVKSLNMQVIFIPYLNGEGYNASNMPSLMTIDQLVAGNNVDFNSRSYTYLDDLTVNGTTIDSFDDTLSIYSVSAKADAMPTIAAKSSNFNVSINAADALGETTVITVTDSTGALLPKKYYVTINEDTSTTEERKTFEDFENQVTVFSSYGVVKVKDETDAPYVTVMKNSLTGDHYLNMASSVNSWDDNYDIQVRTRPEAIAGDVSVIDFLVNCENPVDNYPAVIVADSKGKIGDGNVFAFVSTEPRLFNAMDNTEFIDFAAADLDMQYSAEKWYNVRVVLDKPNKTITTTILGCGKEIVTPLPDGRGDDFYIAFQSAKGTALNVDDIAIYDNSYANEYLLNYSFEQSGATAFSGITNAYFPYTRSNKTYNVVYDSVTDNTYANIPAGATYYTSECFDVKATGSTIIEYSLKTDASSNLTTSIRKSSGTKPTLFTITNGIATVNGVTKDVSDGAFHTYKVVIFSNAAGNYSASVFIDGSWVKNVSIGDSSRAGTYRSDVALTAASSAVGLDDYSIYYPLSPKLTCSVEGRVDVGTETPIILESNTDINYSSRSTIEVLENGKPISCSIERGTDAVNTISIIPTSGSWTAGAIYTINSAGLKDYYDQFYNRSIIFAASTSATEPVALLSYTIDGATVTEGTFTTGAMEVTLTAASHSTSGASIKAFAAKYNSSGVLVGVLPITLNITGSGVDTASDTIDIGTDVSEVKLMAWDTVQNPITDVIKLQ